MNHGFFGLQFNIPMIRFIAEIVPSSATDRSFWLAPVLQTSYFLSCLVSKHFTTIWNYKMFQAHVVFSLRRPGIRHFSQELWVLLLENGIWKLRPGGVGVLISTAVLLVPGPVTGWKWEIPCV